MVPTEMSLGYRFKRIHDSAEADINKRLLAHGLTLSQVSVLSVLLEARGAMTPRELEKRLGLTHPTVIGLLRRLEIKGFIESRPCPGDRRCRSISLTERGRAQRAVIGDSDRALTRRLAGGMSDEQVATLVELLDAVYQNLKATPREIHSC